MANATPGVDQPTGGVSQVQDHSKIIESLKLEKSNLEEEHRKEIERLGNEYNNNLESVSNAAREERASLTRQRDDALHEKEEACRLLAALQQTHEAQTEELTETRGMQQRASEEAEKVKEENDDLSNIVSALEQEKQDLQEMVMGFNIQLIRLSSRRQ